VPSGNQYTGTRFAGKRHGVPRYSGLKTAIASGQRVRGVSRYEARFNSSPHYDDGKTRV